MMTAFNATGKHTCCESLAGAGWGDAMQVIGIQEPRRAATDDGCGRAVVQSCTTARWPTRSSSDSISVDRPRWLQGRCQICVDRE
jgi:hypothetical protein